MSPSMIASRALLAFGGIVALLADDGVLTLTEDSDFGEGGGDSEAWNDTAGAASSPFSAMYCSESKKRSSSWIWKSGGTSPSCNGAHATGDGAYMCADSKGHVDHTSIHVKLKDVKSKTGCFNWRTDCEFHMKDISYISFNLGMRNCGSVWAAPLWMTPHPWKSPGGTSGEIDLVELCPVGKVATNFAGCGGAPGGTCHQQKWHSAHGDVGPKHIGMAVSKSGDITVTMSRRRQETGKYSHYMKTATGARDNFPYSFVSDIWNGHGGDGGWKGCHAHNDPHSECEYAITHLKVYGHSGKSVFHSGKCTALNAKHTDHLWANETEMAMEPVSENGEADVANQIVV